MARSLHSPGVHVAIITSWPMLSSCSCSLEQSNQGIPGRYKWGDQMSTELGPALVSQGLVSTAFISPCGHCLASAPAPAQPSVPVIPALLGDPHCVRWPHCHPSLSSSQLRWKQHQLERKETEMGSLSAYQLWGHRGRHSFIYVSG